MIDTLKDQFKGALTFKPKELDALYRDMDRHGVGYVTKKDLISFFKKIAGI